MKVRFLKWACETRWSHYSETGENSIVLVDEATGEPIVKATVALYPPNRRSRHDEVWLKGWAENDGLPEALQAAGVVKLTGETGNYGHCVAVIGILSADAARELALTYEADPNMAAAREAALRRAPAA